MCTSMVHEYKVPSSNTEDVDAQRLALHQPIKRYSRVKGVSLDIGIEVDEQTGDTARRRIELQTSDSGRHEHYPRSKADLVSLVELYSAARIAGRLLKRTRQSILLMMASPWCSKTASEKHRRPILCVSHSSSSRTGRGGTHDYD
jgi:hypothetical protein